MSRSGYSDDCDGNELNLWRGAVSNAIKGARGQAMLKDLLGALDGMENKRLLPGSFVTPEGEFCTLGILAKERGLKVDDLGDAEDGCDTGQVGRRFGIAPALAAEIMYLNDEYAADIGKWVEVEICGPMPPHHFPPYGHKKHNRLVRVHNENHPAERWKKMRQWVAENLKPI